ncbi:MAG: glycosyl hydrolase family 17 protein [Planctomycetota bacterium]
MKRFLLSVGWLFAFGFAAETDGQDKVERLRGVCFSSVRDNESPARQIHPLPSAIEQDVETASKVARAIRTYTVQSSSYLIAEFCEENYVDCMVGAWIGPARWQNDAQIERLIHLANSGNDRIKAVIVGNEVLHRGDCEEAQLVDYVKTVKREVDQPVAVADTWKAWVEHPNLAAEVDIVGVQIYPFWEGLPIDGAAEYTLKRVRDVQEACPGKRVILTEFGWPTDGDALGQAEPSPENAARYFREVIPLLEEAAIEYFYFALWDEKWKVGAEGGVGAHWGVFESDGSVKPAFVDLLPASVRKGSQRPPRAVTFQLAADEARNAALKVVAMGAENVDAETLELSQRSAGLESSGKGSGSGSYSGPRPPRIESAAPDDTEEGNATQAAEDQDERGRAVRDEPTTTRNEGSARVQTPKLVVPPQIEEREADDDRWSGVCLSLFRDNESPHFGITPLISEVRDDVKYASSLAGSVRTYSAADSFAFVPEFAIVAGVDCYAGAALGEYPWLNELELEMLIHLGQTPNSRLKALIVGNEVMHRHDFSVEQYIDYIRRVKRQVKVRVAIAELLHSWLEHPELADEVDIIGVQIYPYWGGVPIEDAAQNTIDGVKQLQARFPKKKVVLTEFGWPTAGGKLGGAEASPENAARYVREVIPLLEENGIEYLYFAMADEKWKSQDEGGPGAHWGVLQSDGSVKESFQDLVPKKASQAMSRLPRKMDWKD